MCTRPVRGSVILPGSKSITNRALILAALATSTQNISASAVTLSTDAVVHALVILGNANVALGSDGSVYLAGGSGNDALVMKLAPDLGSARWIELMEVDKKNEGGAIKFILLKPLGAPSITSAPQAQLLATLAAAV